MRVNFLVVLMLTALLIPFSIYAEPSRPNDRKYSDGDADLLNVALEVAKATSAPRVSVEPVRRPAAARPVVVIPQPTGGAQAVVVYHRSGDIAPPTGYHHYHRKHVAPGTKYIRNSSSTKIISAPFKK